MRLLPCLTPLPAGIGLDVRTVVDHEDTTPAGRVLGPAGNGGVRHREVAPVPLHCAGDPLGRTPRTGCDSRTESTAERPEHREQFHRVRGTEPGFPQHLGGVVVAVHVGGRDGAVPVGHGHRRRPEHRVRRQPDAVGSAGLVERRDLVPAVDARGVDDGLLRGRQDIPRLGEQLSLVVVGADDQRHGQQSARLRHRQRRLRQHVVTDDRAVGNR